MVSGVDELPSQKRDQKRMDAKDHLMYNVNKERKKGIMWHH